MHHYDEHTGPHKGDADGEGAKKGMRCGVILDAPVGLNDGIVNGQKYFECTAMYVQRNHPMNPLPLCSFG